MMFKTPLMLMLVPIVLGAIILIRKKKKEPTLRFSSTTIAASLKNTWKGQLQKFPYYLRLCSLILMLIALAGPRSVLEETVHKTEGIDIVLAIDVSGSMAGEDFVINNTRYNRLHVVKQVVSEFIESRETDRIGLVAFAALAYTASPLTTDHSWLLKNLERITLGLIKDGTAVGSAIISAVGRLRHSDAKSKVIVLLTDGASNAGKVSPIEAARVAQAFGIKIYTVGAGTNGYVPYPAVDLWGRKVYQKALVKLDEEMLTQVAETTGGKYFKASDTDSLRKVYKEIDALEKVKIEEYGYKEFKELFGYFLIAAMVIIGIESVLTQTLLLTLP